ncbi:MAG: hypothetical protein ACI4EN_09680 [Butyrivibrio sp.]
MDRYTDISHEIADRAYKLFTENYVWYRNVRSLGIRMTELVDTDEPEQLMLFVDEDGRKKHQDMDKTVDALREKFGAGIIKRGIMYTNEKLSEGGSAPKGSEE